MHSERPTGSFDALSALLVVSTALSTTACVTSYGSAPPLSFQDLPYTSTDNAPWPSKRVLLPEIAERYGLSIPPSLSYVELNPEGVRTLIFIHGLGSYLKFWRHQLDVFATEGHRVIAIDMLGYGKSDKPTLFPYTTESMAEVLRAFVRAIEADRPVLVGHSMGGQVALSYAIQFPESVSALVLTSPAGFERFTKREIAWFKSAFTTTLVKGSTEDGIWGSIRRNNFYRWRPDLEWLIEERVRLVGSPDFDQYALANVKSVHGLAENSFVRENLDRVRAPALIIFGSEDRLIPNPFMHGGPTREIMEHGREHIRDSRLVELTGCGHAVQLDCSEEYNREVKRFLDILSPTGEENALQPGIRKPTPGPIGQPDT